MLLRARTTGNAFDMKLPLQVAELLKQSREQASQAHVQLLAASGLLYAANGQQQATREITWVGGGATLGILLLLLLAFRRWRALLAFVPVLVGMLFGAVACVAFFGHMHVMTLVLGSSLIGVAVDYPLHYLSKSWSLKPWHSWPALRLTLSGLSLSLATSCIGYLALAWTPFPALTQIAVFSAAGLLGAYLSAVCLLPALLKGADLRPAQWPLKVCEALLALREKLLQKIASPLLLGLLMLFCAGGLWQLNSKNDIRQWADQQQLLERQSALGSRLEQLVNLNKLQGFLSLNQLVSLPSEQQRLRDSLQQLQPLLDLGVPLAALQKELAELQALPIEDIDSALAGPLGEPWRGLWLGPYADGVAGMVSLQGLNNAELLRVQAMNLPGVQLVDRLGDLNKVFAATQISAAELKLASCVPVADPAVRPWRGLAHRRPATAGGIVQPGQPWLAGPTADPIQPVRAVAGHSHQRRLRDPDA